MTDLTKRERDELDAWIRLKGYRAIGELTKRMVAFMRADQGSANSSLDNEAAGRRDIKTDLTQ
jgi:hypothetical protein